MATLASELFLIVLFYSVKTAINGQIITVPVELHTTVDLPCGQCNISLESTVAVQWHIGSNSDMFVGDGTALASWSKGRTGHSQGFGIKDDFSLIIYNLTDHHDQDLYRCIVTPVGGAAECTHGVKLGLYAKPDSSPVIEYIQQTNGFNVTCSINNVFPMAFPIMTTKEGKRTVYNNSDGTYNTSVTHWFPANEKDTTIECLYSNLNFKSVSSLRIVGSDTIDQNITRLWMVWIIPIEGVLCFIVIVYALKTALRKTTRNNTNDIDQDKHHGENSEEA